MTHAGSIACNPRGEVRQHLRLSRREFVIVDEPFSRDALSAASRDSKSADSGAARRVRLPTGTASPTESRPTEPLPRPSPSPSTASSRLVARDPGPVLAPHLRPSAPAAPAAPSAGAIERRLAAFGGKVHRATVLQTEAAHESVVRLSRLSRRLEVPGGAVRFARVINLRAPRTHPVGTDIARGAPGDADERVRGRVRVVAPADRGPAGRGTVLGDAIVEQTARKGGRWGKVRGKG